MSSDFIDKLFVPGFGNPKTEGPGPHLTLEERNKYLTLEERNKLPFVGGINSTSRRTLFYDSAPTRIVEPIATPKEPSPIEHINRIKEEQKIEEWKKKNPGQDVPLDDIREELRAGKGRDPIINIRDKARKLMEQEGISRDEALDRILLDPRDRNFKPSSLDDLVVSRFDEVQNLAKKENITRGEALNRVETKRNKAPKKGKLPKIESLPDEAISPLFSVDYPKRPTIDAKQMGRFKGVRKYNHYNENVDWGRGADTSAPNIKSAKYGPPTLDEIIERRNLLRDSKESDPKQFRNQDANKIQITPDRTTKETSSFMSKGKKVSQVEKLSFDERVARNKRNTWKKSFSGGGSRLLAGAIGGAIVSSYMSDGNNETGRKPVLGIGAMAGIGGAAIGMAYYDHEIYNINKGYKNYAIGVGETAQEQVKLSRVKEVKKPTTLAPGFEHGPAEWSDYNYTPDRLTNPPPHTRHKTSSLNDMKGFPTTEEMRANPQISQPRKVDSALDIDLYSIRNPNETLVGAAKAAKLPPRGDPAHNVKVGADYNANITARAAHTQARAHFKEARGKAAMAATALGAASTFMMAGAVGLSFNGNDKSSGYNTHRGTRI
jgi:hypothetical protein